MPRTHRQSTRYLQLIFATLWKEDHSRIIHRGAHAHDCYETSGGNGSSRETNEGLIVENRASVTVNNILPDEKANEVFNKIDGNIVGVDWEAEPPEH